MSRSSIIIAVIVLTLLISASGALAQGPIEPLAPTASAGTAFTYQGQLKQNGSPVTNSCDFQFSLYDALNGGAQMGSTQTKSAVAVASGLFTVTLDFGASAFPGAQRWLDIQVRCPAGSGSYVPLTPRQELTPAPYAMYAGNSGALQGRAVGSAAPGSGQVLKWDGSAWSPADDVVGSGGSTYSAGTGLSLNGTQFSVATAYQLPQACNANQIIKWTGSAWTCAADSTGSDWMLNGNLGTASSNYLGTRDAMTLTLAVSGTAALRLVPNDISPNVIGGYSGNVISDTVVGGTIGGGGEFGHENRVWADYATVGGGDTNYASGYESTVGGGGWNTASGDKSTVGGGWGNTASGGQSTVGGGWGNTASGYESTVGGGYGNTASGVISTVGGGDGNTASNDSDTVGGGNGNTANGFVSTVGGGEYNTASGYKSTVGGGYYNTANGDYATVPGGSYNNATGDYSFAAGQRAKANHDGTFVWADNNNGSATVFVSTGADQFLVRAKGGMGVGTNAPAAQLHVASGGSPQMRLDQTTAADYARLRLAVSGSANFWDIAAGPNANNVLNFFRLDKGNVMSLTPDGGTNYLVMGNSARLTAGGTWTNASDRNLKTNFESVDSRAVLAQVVNLPITSWNYTAEDVATRHLGPMAQDFYSAFQLGADDKSITTVDEGGVALAAIQGLNGIVQEKEARIAQLEARLSALEQTGLPTGVGVLVVVLAAVLVMAVLGVMVMRRRGSGGAR